jgi:tetratricopeptide (TPR) repeat protein
MFRNLTLVVALMIGVAGTVLSQQRVTTPSASTNRANQQTEATTVFRSARDSITDGDWAKAQEKFDEYVKSYPNEKNLDAALYWLAYSQQKLGRYDQCRDTVARLLEKYPSTTWKDDARVLLAQVPGAYAVAVEDLVNAVSGRAAVAAAQMEVPPQPPVIVEAPVAVAIEPGIVYAGEAPVAITPGQIPGAWRIGELSDSKADDNDPCEFKIVVLQALFQTDLQRGIMVATDWLKPGSTQTLRCKSAALTLLGRNGGKTVTPVILGVARNESDLKLRARAISALGASNDDSVVDALRDFALNSPENDIVEAAVYALTKHTGERAIVVLSDIALKGKTIPQRRLAISSISTRPGEPAVDALFRIYDADQSLDIRTAVINGFGNRKSERAGNRLLEIARGSDAIELRKAAISAISRRGGEKAVEVLLNLYDTEKNEELKDRILNSLGFGNGISYAPVMTTNGTTIAYAGRMSDDRVVQKLIQIARNPQEPMQRRKRAIGWLSRSKNPAVLKFLEDLLK